MADTFYGPQIIKLYKQFSHKVVPLQKVVNAELLFLSLDKDFK